MELGASPSEIFYSEWDADLQTRQSDPTPPLPLPSDIHENEPVSTSEEGKRWEELPRLRWLLSEQEEKLKSTRKTLIERENELKQAKQFGRAKEMELEQAKLELRAKDEDFQKVQNRLSDKDKEIQRIQMGMDKELKRVAVEMGALEKEKDELRERNEALKMERTRLLAAEKEKLERSRELLKENEDKWKKGFELAQIQSKTLETDNSQLKERILLKEKALRGMEDNLEEAYAKTDNLEAQVQTLESKIERSSAELVHKEKGWTETMESLESSLHTFMESDGRLKEEKARLEEGLKKVKTELGKANVLNGSLKSELSGCQLQLQEKSEVIKKLTGLLRENDQFLEDKSAVFGQWKMEFLEQKRKLATISSSSQAQPQPQMLSITPSPPIKRKQLVVAVAEKDEDGEEGPNNQMRKGRRGQQKLLPSKETTATHPQPMSLILGGMSSTSAGGLPSINDLKQLGKGCHFPLKKRPCQEEECQASNGKPEASKRQKEATAPPIFPAPDRRIGTTPSHLNSSQATTSSSLSHPLPSHGKHVPTPSFQKR